MPYLKIHNELLTPTKIRDLMKLCPFKAFTYENGELSVNAACKMCGICVKNGPAGVVTREEDDVTKIDKSLWRGVAVYAEQAGGRVHNVTLELLGKARELAGVIGHPVYALLIGHETQSAAQLLLRCGADKVFVYDDPAFADFRMEPYANAFSDFIERVKPSSVLVGATNTGRSLAPRVAARFRTGLTADCTVLEMKENTDLVQIRPAFGGNIMARIVTPNHRPQFCTVRYKIFSAPQPLANPTGTLEYLSLPAEQLQSTAQILAEEPKEKIVDISEADAIVAVGRGIRSRDDLAMAQELAGLLGAQLACTRPLVENGWFDAKRQIGLSGRTVGAKLIITLGISGSVQFAAGMRGCERIIAVNADPAAPIFDVAHYGAVGDLYQVLPRLIKLCREGKQDALS